MKKLTAVFAITVVALSVVCVVCVILLLQTEPESSEVPVMQVMITEIECDGVGHYNGREYRVNVNVTNYGTDDVEGLVVAVRDDSGEVTSANTKPVGLIEAGSTKTITFSGSYSWLQGLDVFTLMFREVLDEGQNDFPVMNAKIIKIDWDESGYSRGREYWVEVTVQNDEDYDIDGLTLSIRDESDEISSGNTHSVGLIRAGSKKTIEVSGSYYWLQEIDIITLMFDDEIVHEQYYGLSKWLP